MKQTEQLLTIEEFICKLRMQGLKTDLRSVEAMIKADELDAEEVSESEYRIPEYEIERLIAAQYTTEI